MGAPRSKSEQPALHSRHLAPTRAGQRAHVPCRHQACAASIHTPPLQQPLGLTSACPAPGGTWERERHKLLQKIFPRMAMGTCPTPGAHPTCNLLYLRHGQQSPPSPRPGQILFLPQLMKSGRSDSWVWVTKMIQVPPGSPSRMLVWRTSCHEVRKPGPHWWPRADVRPAAEPRPPSDGAQTCECPATACRHRGDQGGAALTSLPRLEKGPTRRGLFHTRT